MDATSDRDFMLDYAQAASTLGLHISRFAEELTLYATAEFGFVDLPEAFSTGSSAMPQKKNPDLTELVAANPPPPRRRDRLATLIKGLPLAYNKDLQEAQEQSSTSPTPSPVSSVSCRPSPPPSPSAPSACAPPRRPASSTPWRQPPISRTRAFPSATPTKSSATPSASASTKNVNWTISHSTTSSTQRTLQEDFFAAISLEATLDCHDVLGGTARNRVRWPSPKPAFASPGFPIICTPKRSYAVPTRLATAHESTASTRRVKAELVRKAKLQDAANIFDLVNSLSHDGTLLRRSYAEICENVRDFTVAESESGVFLGCGALHLYGPHLAEVRSIVVKPEAKGQGAGGELLHALLAEAEEQKVTAVCLFTRIPDFFFHFGFRVVDRTALPDKIYKDCQTCPRLYACDEVAMVRGPLPKIAVLAPAACPTRVSQTPDRHRQPTR